MISPLVSSGLIGKPTSLDQKQPICYQKKQLSSDDDLKRCLSGVSSDQRKRQQLSSSGVYILFAFALLASCTFHGCESSLEDTLEEEDHFEFPQSESLHDENHPDHVDDPTSLAFDTLNPMITVPGVDPKHEEDVVITHRKVYVTDKNIGSQAVVHPIKLVIPVDVRHDPSTVIPPPKPIFKMKKFVDYDRKPVVEMVPVTTTVYKPAGISEDQYIDTRKKLISKSKQI